MHTVIMAGGLGTRISSIIQDIPKPMIDINGKPLLERQIECLKKQGHNSFTLIIGYLGKVIKNYFGDGRKLNVKIDYIEEQEPLGTAGGLYYLKDKINDTFLLINGDILFDINIKRFIDYHKEKRAKASLFTHPNNHPFDSSIIETNLEGSVINWISKEDKRTDYKNRVNAGIHLIEPVALHSLEGPQKTDLDRQILKPLVGSGSLYAYDSPEYVKDLGTVERYNQVLADYHNGIPQQKSLLCRQKAVFLDRDGTINVYKGYITEPAQIELIDGAAEAIKLINKSGYLAIVVTNQPVIARGECTFEKMRAINNRIETLLGKQGAYLDDIIICPHHPDKGFEGERPEYKIACECRKPEPGMLIEAAKKYNIDLSKSYMIGDDERDTMAGRNAGCKSFMVRSEGLLKITQGII